MLWGHKALSARPAPCLLILPWSASVSLLGWNESPARCQALVLCFCGGLPGGCRGPERLDGPGDSLIPRTPSVLGAADPPELCWGAGKQRAKGGGGRWVRLISVC